MMTNSNFYANFFLDQYHTNFILPDYDTFRYYHQQNPYCFHFYYGLSETRMQYDWSLLHSHQITLSKLEIVTTLQSNFTAAAYY